MESPEYDMNWLLQHKRKTGIRTSVYMFFYDSHFSVLARVYAWLFASLLLVSVFWGILNTSPGCVDALHVWEAFEYVTSSLILLDAILRISLIKSRSQIDVSVLVSLVNFGPSIIFLMGDYESGSSAINFIWLLRLPLRFLMLSRDMHYISLVVTAVKMSIEPLRLPLFMMIVYSMLFACVFFWVERDDNDMVKNIP